MRTDRGRAKRIRRFPYIAVAWAAASLALAVIFATSGSHRQALVYNASSCFAAAAIAAAVWRRPSLRRSHWYCLLAGQALLAFADVLYFHHEVLFGWAPPKGMGYAEPVYFAALAALGLAMAKLARARGGAVPDGIDAAMVATTAALFTWAFLIDPILDEVTIAGLEQVLAVAYSVAGVAIIGLTAWFGLAPGSLSPASGGLTFGYLAWLVASIEYGHQALVGSYVPGTWLDFAFIISYLSVGFAALHPTLSTVAEAAPARGPGADRRRMSAVAATAMVGPVVLGLGSLRGVDLDAADLTVACTVLFVLAVTRMIGLIGALDQSVSRLQQLDADRARLLDAVIDAAECERGSLALELHDGPVQHMATVSLQLELALMAVESGDTPEAERELAKARASVEAEVTALRDLMVGLRPPALGERGLADAVGDYVRGFSERSGLPASVSACLPRRIDPAKETVLYRVLQESLSNVHKHARAHNVEVFILGDGDVVSLVVRDDGVGFDLSDSGVVRKAGHLGIVGMQERVELAGGMFAVESTPGHGTTVRAVMATDHQREKQRDVATAGVAG